MSTKGVDVSKYQGNIDFAKVKAAGVDFVIIRAGYGKVLNQKDPCFETNYTKAKAAGLPVGAYWYSYSVSVEEAQQEADVCLQAITGKTFDYPVFYDIEESKQATLGKSVCTAMTLAFCEKIKAAGYQAGVYANKNFFTNYVDAAAVKDAGYYRWIAHYGTNADYSTEYDIHQYSSTGSVDGISGNVDMNYGFTSFETSTETAPIPTPPETPAVDVIYRVRTQKDGWLPEVKNLGNYAGWEDSPVTDVAVKVTQGDVKYRVHVKGGNWLPYVTGYDSNESKNGYAGNGKEIDAIEIYYTTPSGQTVKKAKYRVAPVGGDYYSWQLDNEKTNGQDGYAGMLGKSIGKLQVTIE